MKKTKIICTIGPNISDKNVMMEFARNGTDVTRFNFSHGDYNEHQGHLELSKEVRKELDIPVAALLDTKGPEIRTGQLKNDEKMTLKEDQAYTLTTKELVRDDTVGYISYNGLNEDVAADNRILIDGGLIELEVRGVKDTDIVCKVVNGGGLGKKKGVNVPNIKIKLLALTNKGKGGIRFETRRDFDFIAASFVRTADCIEEIGAMLDEQGSGMEVIAETENAEDTENLNTIIETANGIMVARGDMGVKIPAEKVPHIQKKVIRRYNEARKIVITATQMLDSMIRNPRPTRAKVTDVTNAMYDGTGAVMLSGETAMGKYPMDVLKMMVSIALEAEMHLDYAEYRQRKVTEQDMKNVSNAVCFASVPTARGLDTDVIIAPSITGFITQMLSKWRPDARIIDMSLNMTAVRQMQLQWDVVPVQSRRAGSASGLIEDSVEELKDRGLVEESELTVIVARVVTYARHYEAATQINIMRVINIE